MEQDRSIGYTDKDFGRFYVVLKLDLKKNSYECIYSHDQEVYGIVRKTEDYDTFIQMYIEKFIHDADKTKVRDFLLSEKLTPAVSERLVLNAGDYGQKQGEYLVDALDLDNQDGPFNIELFTGDPGDNNCNFFFGGAMDVLQKYIDEGKLVVKSGQTEFEQVATANWDSAKAQDRMDTIIADNYSDGSNLDAVLCSNDSTALGVENALAASYTGEYPIITGQDCDTPNVKNLVAGKQAMSVFKDTRALATAVVGMVDSIMKGEEPEINDTESYDNGTGVIPTYLCDPVVVTVDNYKEMLIDSGYYTEDQIK